MWSCLCYKWHHYCTKLYGGNITHNAGPILLLISVKVMHNVHNVAIEMTKKKVIFLKNFCPCGATDTETR
jgi:hypothetical protein